MKKIHLLTIALLAAGSLTASADSVSVIVGGGATAADISIPSQVTYGINGPVTSGNYTWSSTNFNSVFGYTGAYGFGANGSWDSSMGPMIGLNDGTDTMTIGFTNAVYSFGDFFNYAPNSGGPATINIYTVGGTLLDSYILTFATGGANNSGEWLEFTSTTAIGYITLSGDDIAMTSTPEPSTLTYFLLAAACGGGLFFFRRQAAA
jgi:hypothetical protein